ncbi:MAG: hypothetical protein D4R94_04365 [Chitinophagaceae bacterium]|nr:MAG: hypothetical protein D4R94_04365 [Chitinophagaceae bacterium]
MKYKIITNNAPHRRWIKFGVLTQQNNDYSNYKVNRQKPSTEHHLILKNEDNAIENDLKSFVSLDAADFLGRDFIKLTTSLSTRGFSNVFIVGDLGVSESPIPTLDNVVLLYNQNNANDIKKLYKSLHSNTLYENFSNGIYPGFFYGTKDLLKHPLKVSKLLFEKNNLILFAGQDGSHSIYNIFSKHTKEPNNLQSKVKNILDKLSNEIVNEPSVTNASNSIIKGVSEISFLLENTPYAIEQTNLKVQRETIIFKSLFRFILIRLLIKQGLITIIKYPEEYIRIYNSNWYNRHTFIDFGGVNGYEKIYPRVADMIYNQLPFVQFDQEEMKLCQQKNSIADLASFIDVQMDILRRITNKNIA